MIETRKSIVLPGHPHLEAAVLRDALFGDVELGHHLDARIIELWNWPGDRAASPAAARRRSGT
jgi:hypothetical protein